MPISTFRKKFNSRSESIFDGLPSNPNKLFNQLCDSALAKYLDKDGLAKVRKAYSYAQNAHYGQQRKSGEQFIIHPLQVAFTLSELKLDENSICAAILLDVRKAKDSNNQNIGELFGEDVETLVDGVSKIGKLQFSSREHAEAGNIRKMLMAMAKDIRVIIIKLADRLHNMRTLSVLPTETQRRISLQTLEIFAPLANRLGLYQWNVELQELCFKHIYPKRYDALIGAIKIRDGNRKAKVRKMRADIQSAIDRSGIYATVTGRRKGVYSIYKKMVQKKRNFEQLNDIYGFRIIVDNVDDCYRALGVIHNNYKPIPGRFSDYVAIPKANGYQSLHTVAFGPFGDNIEIQIRTEGMHRTAEAGVAAHWMYKSDNQQSEEKVSVNLSRQWLIDLLDPDSHSSNPSEFLEHLKTDLYSDKVYVFTPRGDIKKLPRGATALDFAYAVHTGVGSRSVSAKINSKSMSLSTVLRNGDHVEIVTQAGSSPSLAWLNFAVTGRARSHIRAFLNSQSTSSALKIGKKLLKQEAKSHGFRKRSITKEMKDQFLLNVGLNSWDDLLVEIGRGQRIAYLVLRQLFPENELSNNKKIHSDETEENPVVIKGSEGLVINFSRCCCPVPGDPIAGVVTVGSGLVIHNIKCPNFLSMQLQVDKSVPVQWSEEVDMNFPVKLRVYVRNQRGMFVKVAAIIAEQDCNILEVETAESTEEFQPIDIIIEVKDRVHLAQVIKHLRHDSDVQRVKRKQG